MKKLLVLSAIVFLKNIVPLHAANHKNNYASGISILNAEKRICTFIDNPRQSINIRAVRNFLMSYNEATESKWSEIKDKGYMCTFLLNGILNRAHYDINGEWQCTIATYQESQLPKNIRHIVKQVYYDYAISFINEISLAENRTIYVVQVQDEKCLKILRIADDQMELVEEIEK